MDEQKYCIMCGAPCRKNDKNFCSDYCKNRSIERDREMLKRPINWSSFAPINSEIIL